MLPSKAPQLESTWTDRIFILHLYIWKKDLFRILLLAHPRFRDYKSVTESRKFLLSNQDIKPNLYGKYFDYELGNLL